MKKNNNVNLNIYLFIYIISFKSMCITTHKILPESNNSLQINSSISNHNVSNIYKLLNCRTFICLLYKFDLLKTSNGYILSPYKDTIKNIKKPCKHRRMFECWIEQYTFIQKTYGWEMEKTGNHTINIKKISTEPEWSMDISDLMQKK